MMVRIVTICWMFFAAMGATAQERARMDIALLLDTSGSMDGLIEQAKAKLWDVVNDLATARHNGEIPELYVSLYHYGNSGLPASEGHIQQLVPLTRDLDKVSQELFALNTNGGNEFCGQVIQTAHRQLAWGDGKDHYKAIFIAGNEPFNQGQVDYRKACQNAIADGIVVNTIYCGDQQEGVKTFWQEGANLADGSYMIIDHNQAIAAIEAPQDADILRLNQALNETYIAYGASGETAKSNQVAQDANAATVNREVAVKRALTKSSALYKNEEWDLVDAVKEDKVAVAEVEEEALPAPMRDMSTEERTQYVTAKAEERQRIQTELQALKKARAEYVAQQVKEQSGNLGHAMSQAIRKQLKAKKFTFTDEKP